MTAVHFFAASDFLWFGFYKNMFELSNINSFNRSTDNPRLSVETLGKGIEVLKFIYKNITIKHFYKIDYAIKNIVIVIVFVIAFLAIGKYEGNLYLPNDGLGLFEQRNIWIFLFSNLLIPIIFWRLFNRLNKKIDNSLWNLLQENILIIANQNAIKIISSLAVVVGFCFFVGNSLQNAHIINNLPFDFWDSKKYIISYCLSRIYKLYLFAYGIPFIMTYVFVLMIALSKLLVIDKNELHIYPIRGYENLKIICNFGLNILIVLMIPLVLLTVGIYFVHSRLDITTMSSILISAASTTMLFLLYWILIRNFHISVENYQNINIGNINKELFGIYQYVLSHGYRKKDIALLGAYLKREKYLRKTKKRIEKIPKYPFIEKALFTSILPMLPPTIKTIYQMLNTFLNSDILEKIL